MMSNLPHATVTKDAYLTLHYRIASTEGLNIISTFEDKPATLQMSSGQLAPFLEACLIGLPEDAHETFELAPEAAFGLHNPDLIQHVSHTTLTENSQLGEAYKIGDLVEFAAPGGGHFAGILRELRADGAVFDFNHPLAGRTVKFEVKIIGIL